MKTILKLSILFAFVFALAPIKIQAEEKQSDSNPFSYISNNCRVVGYVNVSELAKVDFVKKHIEIASGSFLPGQKMLYNILKSQGISLENLQGVYFGSKITSAGIGADKAESSQLPIFILELKSKINFQNIISTVEKQNLFKIKTDSILSKQAFSLTSASKSKSSVIPDFYVVQLNDALIALGSKQEITNTISLYEKKGGSSILDNESFVKFSNSIQGKNMAWVTASISPKLIKNLLPGSPDLDFKNIFLGVNSTQDQLSFDGKIVCANVHDVQKIMLTAQILAFLAVSSSNNAIQPGDISIRAEKNNFLMNIKLSKDILNSLSNNKPAEGASEEDLYYHSDDQSEA